MYNNPSVFSPFIRSKQPQSDSKTPLDSNASLEELIEKSPLETNEVLDLGTVNHIPFKGWEHLSTEKKISILHSVAHSGTQGKQEAKSRLGEKIQNISSFLERGIIPEQLKDADVSPDNIRMVFGESLGSRLSSQLQYQAQLASNSASLFTAPEVLYSIGQEELKKLEPQPQDLTGADFKNKVFTLYITSRAQSLVKNALERKDKPIKWGIFRNGRKPDGAMPRGGRRPTGRELLFPEKKQ